MNTDSSAELKPPPAIADTHDKRLQWWINLEPQWRAAFGLAVLKHHQLPTPDELELLWQTPTLRFAGPKAAYPNLNFELTNCSGVVGMSNLELLIITYHQLTSVAEVASLSQLKNLYVHNNRLQNLQGIESLQYLEGLYVHVNELESIAPIRSLHNLRNVYVCLNNLRTLDGLTRQHANNLKSFYCLPNDALPDREVMRVERRLGIRCRTV